MRPETRPQFIALLLALALLLWAVPVGAFAQEETGGAEPGGAEPAETTTTVTGLPDSVVLGEDVEATVTVTSDDSTPEGDVVTTTGDTELTTPLDGGTTTVDLSDLGVGTHELRFAYTGSDEHAESSATSTLVVNEPDEEPEPEPEPDGPREVHDAQLRWGINNEVNNRAFAPGTFNFMSAGKIGNPGAGAMTLRNDNGKTWSNGRPAGWSARDGNVSLQKYSASAGRYTDATWDGLKTDTNGVEIPGATSGKFSGHQVVLDAGTGEIDTSEGRAEIRWKGSFTVLMYSGMSFFYVTDPVLTVRNGTGTLTATLSGYGSSMDDMTKWTPIDPTSVTLADLGRVDLSAAKGVEIEPRYSGVEVTPGPSQMPQVRSGDHWGAFPQSFVTFQDGVGTAPYWYSSGGAADAFKPASPVNLSWSASDPLTPSAPPAGPGAADTVSNSLLQAPPVQSASLPTTAPPTAGVTGASITPPPHSDAAPASTELPLSSPVGTLLAASALPATRWPWLAGTLLLLLAAAIAGTPLLRRGTVRP